VYMVKVTPVKGPAYYYIDTDGDGKLELDADQRALNPVQPVYWKVKLIGRIPSSQKSCANNSGSGAPKPKIVNKTK